MSSYGQGSGRERESRHLWVGGLPDDIDEAGIKEFFTRYGKIEGVKILPQKYPNIGVAAFIDFYDIKSATEAKEAKHKLHGHELRTNFKAGPGERRDSGGTRSHDRERHEERRDREERESDSSSSMSGSGSSSSSSSSDSDQDSRSAKKARKKASGGGGGGGGGPMFLKIVGLASRPDRVLMDGLYYEFCRYSNNVAVRLYGDSDRKWAMVKYKRTDKCKEALAQSQGMILFGSKLKLSAMDVDDFPPGGHDLKRGSGGDPAPMSEDLDPLATRSLFVGNIPKHISVYELRDAFLRYGNVLDVEIKKMGGNATYGFILYYDLMSAVTAKQYMDGHDLKGNKLRVGFGKGTASKQVWIDGIDPAMSESQLERHLSKYGRIIRLGIDRHRCCAMVQYDGVDSAKEALNSVKGTFIKNSRKLMTDFANRDARAAFFARMDAGDTGLPPPRGFPGPPGPMYGADMDPRLMMPPRPGGMHMMGRGGGYPPHGPPMDFYYNPYMEGFFGGGRLPYGPPGMHNFPPGPGRGFGREGPDDYEEELRAFSRKREREKRRRQETSSDSTDSFSDKEDNEAESHRRKKPTKPKEKVKKVSKKPRKEHSDEGETDSDSDEQHEEARLKATRKSRDLREKLKKLPRKGKNNASSDGDSSGDNMHGQEDGVRKTSSPSTNDRGALSPSPGPKKDARNASPDGRKARKDASPSPDLKKGLNELSPDPKVASKVLSPLQGPNKPRKASSPASKPPVTSPSPEPRRAHKQSSPSPDSKKGRKVVSPITESKKGRRASPSAPKTRRASSPAPDAKKATSPDSRKARKAASPDPKKARKAASPASDNLSPQEGERKYKGKSRQEQKLPDLQSPQTPPPSNIPAVKQKMKVETEEIVDPRSRSRKERQKERSVREEATSKSRGSHKDISNGAMVESGKVAKEELDAPHDSKNHRAHNSTSEIAAKGERMDTPQSPSKSSHSSNHAHIESELSSGEDFKEAGSDWGTNRSKSSAAAQKQEWSGGREKSRKQDRSKERDMEQRHPSSSSRSTPPRPRTPEYPLDDAPPDREEELSKKARQLPRRYQIESGGAEQGYRDGLRHGKDRHYHPSSPSPPPQSFSGYARKRYYYSPPPPEGDRRRSRRSPVGGHPQRRRYSRSPPYLGSPPPMHRVKSPRGGSSPHSRPRSPIPRARAPRRRYESPPFDNYRGKYMRGHGSPPSPHHRHPFTPSPPPPHSGGRSPPGRRYGRRHSASLSPPPRSGRGGRRERSPPPEPMRASPRPPDDRYDSRKRHVKRGVYSRSPSPKDKYREYGKEEYSDQKRRRTRPKSPSGTPPPSREDSKGDVPSKQAHQPDSVQPPSSSDQQRSFKQSASTGSQHSSSSHRQAADVSTKPTRNQAAPPKAQSNPVPTPENSLMDLLRRYPVMWQGLLMLKNDSAAVQLHFLSGNVQLAKSSLPQQPDQQMPILRISQRMRLEKTQLEGVDRRIQTEGEHCLLLALPCGRDATDVHTQTHALKNNLINYLLQKQAAGIINIPAAQSGYVLHIFPPCPFSQSHLSRVAPDLLSNASVNCHLMIVVATM